MYLDPDPHCLKFVDPKHVLYLNNDKRCRDGRPFAPVGQLEPEVGAVALQLVAGVGGGQGEVGRARTPALPQRAQAAHIQRLAPAAQGLEEGGVEDGGAREGGSVQAHQLEYPYHTSRRIGHSTMGGPFEGNTL